MSHVLRCVVSGCLAVLFVSLCGMVVAADPVTQLGKRELDVSVLDKSGVFPKKIADAVKAEWINARAKKERENSLSLFEPQPTRLLVSLESFANHLDVYYKSSIRRIMLTSDKPRIRRDEMFPSIGDVRVRHPADKPAKVGGPVGRADSYAIGSVKLFTDAGKDRVHSISIPLAYWKDLDKLVAARKKELALRPITFPARNTSHKATDGKLAVMEEYVGPLPEKLGTMIAGYHVTIDDETDRVAYAYRYDAPEMLHKSGTVMQSPRLPPVKFMQGGGSSVVHVSGKPTVRVFDDGISSEPYHIATRPKIHRGAIEYIGQLKRLKDGLHVFRDGVPGKAFFETFNGWQTSKIRQKNIGWIVSKSLAKNARYQLLVDDKLGPAFDAILAFDYSTSERLIYVATQKKTKDKPSKMQVVVDQKAEALFDDVRHVVTSPDGRRYAYKAGNQITKDRDKWRVIIDGKPQPAYDSLGKKSLTFSPDSKRFAYVSIKDKKYRAVIDGKEQAALEYIIPKSLIFSADSKHVGYLALHGGKWIVVVDGRVKTAVKNESREPPESLVLSPTGRPFFIAKRGKDEQLLVTTGKGDREWFNTVSKPVFNADGSQYAYVGNRKRGEKNVAVVIHNGKPSEEYQGAFNLRFSADGKQLAYRASQGGKWFLVVDGKQGTKYDGIDRAVLSADFKRQVMRVRRDNKYVMIVDGKETASYKYDPFFVADGFAAPVLSADGKHYAYAAKRDKKQFLVIDGQESPTYDRILLRMPRFVSPTRVRFFAARDGMLLRVYADLKGAKAFAGEKRFSQAQVDDWIKKAQTFGGQKDKRLMSAGYYFKAAVRGNAEAQCDVGALYAHKVLPHTDPYRIAVKWFQKAADQGLGRAMYNLGIMSSSGSGVEKSTPKALEWYRKAAEKGYPSAANKMGVFYQNGYAVPKDDHAAFKWYLKAAELGHVEGQINVGFFYQEGRGTPVDYTAAMKWFQLAAKQGSALGMAHIGYQCEKGFGVQRNIEVAKGWYRLAARKGNRISSENLQKLLPAEHGTKGIKRWFVSSRKVNTVTRTRANGDVIISKQFEIKMPVPGRAKPWTINVPVYVYSAADIAAVKDSKGFIHSDKLRNPGIEDFRALSMADQSALKAASYGIPIAYPPYLVLGPNLEKEPAGTKETIQKYVELLYETGRK